MIAYDILGGHEIDPEYIYQLAGINWMHTSTATRQSRTATPVFSSHAVFVKVKVATYSILLLLNLNAYNVNSHDW